MIEFHISQNTQKLLDHYKNIHAGHQILNCPYYININKRKADLRSLIGKGTPEEIETEIKIWSNVKKLKLKEATKDEILDLMRNIGIGIDCSGFVAQIVIQGAKDNGKSIKKIIELENFGFVRNFINSIRFIENLNVETLTSEANSFFVKDLREVRPYDLLRLYSFTGMHIAVITDVYIDDDAVKIIYHHSDDKYQTFGIRSGYIIVKDPLKDLTNQIWEDNDKNGENIMLKRYKLNIEDAGFKRLKRF